jgi:hypothetical protein
MLERLQKLLKKKLFNPDRFRLIIIITDDKKEVKDFINTSFPKVIKNDIDCSSLDSNIWMTEINKCLSNNGFIYVENMLDIIKSDSVGVMCINPFNFKREYISGFNTNIICFVSSSDKAEFMKTRLNVLPDMLEFVNCMIEK